VTIAQTASNNTTLWGILFWIIIGIAFIAWVAIRKTGKHAQTMNNEPSDPASRYRKSNGHHDYERIPGTVMQAGQEGMAIEGIYLIWPPKVRRPQTAHPVMDRDPHTFQQRWWPTDFSWGEPAEDKGPWPTETIDRYTTDLRPPWTPPKRDELQELQTSEETATISPGVNLALEVQTDESEEVDLLDPLPEMGGDGQGDA
jgi:hypothetical protein